MPGGAPEKKHSLRDVMDLTGWLCCLNVTIIIIIPAVEGRVIEKKTHNVWLKNNEPKLS